MYPIDVIGMGADGLAALRPEAVERIRAAHFLAGGERMLSVSMDQTVRVWERR